MDREIASTEACEWKLLYDYYSSGRSRLPWKEVLSFLFALPQDCLLASGNPAAFPSMQAVFFLSFHVSPSITQFDITSSVVPLLLLFCLSSLSRIFLPCHLSLLSFGLTTVYIWILLSFIGEKAFDSGLNPGGEIGRKTFTFALYRDMDTEAWFFT